MYSVFPVPRLGPKKMSVLIWIQTVQNSYGILNRFVVQNYSAGKEFNVIVCMHASRLPNA